MNRVLGGRGPMAYECLTCHRVVYAKPNGFMPIHRHKGKREKCKAAGDSVANHKRR